MQTRTNPLKIKNTKNNPPDSKFVILNLGGKKTQIRVLNEAEIPENLIPHKIMVKIYEESKKRDLEIEE